MKYWNCPGIHPMHFDHVNTTNPMERVYFSWDWQHEFKTFLELNQERQIDENGFISPMAMSQVLVCPPLLNEPERINGMPWVEPYRKTCKRIGRKHTDSTGKLKLARLPFALFASLWPLAWTDWEQEVNWQTEDKPFGPIGSLDWLKRTTGWPLAFDWTDNFVYKEGLACYYHRIIRQTELHW
jgi:hypothetical protein